MTITIHRRRGLRPALALGLATALLLSACGGGGGADTATPAVSASLTVNAPAAVLRLPLEVLGSGSPGQPVIAEAALGVASGKLPEVAQLWFQCHRCGFYGAPEFEAASALPVKVKASVRILGGVDDSAAQAVPWVDITDANVTLADDERLHGGVNGGLYTTRITVALDAATRARLVALPGRNRVQFRFNGTDGESNGYRVLDVQLRDGAAVDIGSNTIERFDPASERTPAAIAAINPDDAKAGKELWYGHGVLSKSSIVARKLQAACASCHAENGRDLQYFNYSNNAIVQRSRFHGLSDTQGNQLVAFLRSSLNEVPYVARARPWNPPYQPGPGLDCHAADCATAWSAGAGLEAVLSSPADALKALFGKDIGQPGQPLSISQADVDAVMNPHATLNAREIPIALQFPDWNAWLPTIHPLDVWPTRADGSGFANGAAFPGQGMKNPNGKYKELISWLTAHKNPNGNMADWSHLTPDQRAQIMDMFYISGWEGYNYLGGGRGNHIANNGQFGAQVGAANLAQLAAASTTQAGPANAFGTNAFIERAVASMLHWTSVKQWELAQDFALEGNQQWFIGEKDKATGAWKGGGEAHGWPFNTVSLFFLAPHMVYQEDKDANGRITREWVTAWETNNIVGSYYRSNQWYQLQMTVNPGGQSGWVNYPMDWPYLTAFDDYIAQLVGDATPAARSAQSAHVVRLLQARIKSAQYVNNDIALYDPNQPDLVQNDGRYGRAQVLKHLDIVNYLDKSVPEGVARNRFHFLDEMGDDMYLKVINGGIAMFNTLYTSQPVASWRRCDPNNTMLGDAENVSGFRYCLDSSKQPLGIRADGTRYMHWNQYTQITTEQEQQYGLWQAAQLGAEPARLKTWRDWTGKVWQ